MKQKAFALTVLLVFILLTAVLLWQFMPLVSHYVQHPDLFREKIDQFGFAGRLIFIAAVFVQIIFAVIPGEPFEILAGYAFGSVEGTILCLLASTLGSMAVFALVRKFGIKLVGALFSKKDLREVRFLKSTPKRNYIFFLIFALPGTPKDLLSYFAGLTDMRWTSWLIICSVGRIPSVVTSAIGGSALGEKEYLYAIIAFVVTLCLSAIGLGIYKFICKQRDKHNKDAA